MPGRRPGGIQYGMFIDHGLVEQWLGGLPDVELGLGERREIVRRLTVAGLSASQIAARLRCAERSVTRYRRDLRERGELPPEPIVATV